MGQPHLTVEDSAEGDDIETVRRQLHAHNVAQTGVDDARPLTILLRDDTGQVVGGLCGHTFWGWLAIELLWVHESLRGQGHGSGLVVKAEQEAIARGCRQVLLDTMSFQAPDFYRRLGYEEFGVLEGFAGHHKRHYLKKTLG
jgi:GNAT superfamily N-acetyltransferase